ncbi:MAG: NADH-quinone oxidoreductase subunit NuoG [Propionibacteriaceae bacterium]|jgi:NADH-quinone oxidoreductase subunit G|nr:NADH-quinone oxidoreductase subunit NuoG [Propionibacteriaceae bacterium]
MSEELVTLTIDDREVSVPKGTTIIRAAESIGVYIPRFCDHPGLAPRGSCRQCLVEIPDAGNGRGFPAPQASCTMTVAPGMIVKTQMTSAKAKAAQAGIMELLLINHPLDCPICDKAGECPLQNQALLAERVESRFDGVKRRYEKPVPISSQLLLDRERCVLCARCTRFAEEIVGDPFISLCERGTHQQVGFSGEQPFESIFAGNVVQICPVGALTSVQYRFNARPFDLVSVDTTCEQCAAGCALRTDSRHGTIRRRLAGVNPEVNGEWSCDKGRFTLASVPAEQRITTPQIRENGTLRPASWPEALSAAADGLAGGYGGDAKVGVLTGGNLTKENAAAYASFAREVLHTDSIDFRTRQVSDEETAFLRQQAPQVTYADLETAARVVCVDFDPEVDAPIVFLRLFKAVTKGKLQVLALGAQPGRTWEKLRAELVSGTPKQALKELDLTVDDIILVGERAAATPGTLDTISFLRAKWAWIPSHAGDIGALEAGCLPQADGLTVNGILNAAMDGEIALLTDDIELFAAEGALAKAFTVSLANHKEGIATAADVVLPTALVEEQAGTLVNWEHRAGVVNPAIPGTLPTAAEVLARLQAVIEAYRAYTREDDADFEDYEDDDDYEADEVSGFERPEEPPAAAAPPTAAAPSEPEASDAETTSEGEEVPA